MLTLERLLVLLQVEGFEVTGGGVQVYATRVQDGVDARVLFSSQAGEWTYYAHTRCGEPVGVRRRGFVCREAEVATLLRAVAEGRRGGPAAPVAAPVPTARFAVALESWQVRDLARGGWRPVLAGSR